MRQLVLDTETTGLTPEDHRIIEIACVEIIDRSITDDHFHCYLNPNCDIDPGAIEVHGLTRERLRDEPVFADIVDSFLQYIADSELIIHNAPFDEGFLDAELKRLERDGIRTRHHIVDTLAMAREKHPGRHNDLDALCQRYRVDNSQRTLHGALTDARLLAQVYLAMTGGQASMAFAERADAGRDGLAPQQTHDTSGLLVLYASEEEQQQHQRLLEKIARASDTGECIWRQAVADLGTDP